MTAQISDSILYNGKTHSLYDCPFTDFLKANRIMHFYPRNTALHRGYIANWEIIESKLYLVNLTAYISSKHTIGMEVLFPGEDKVFASWFTGELRIPDGGLLEYVHQGFGSIYERDLFLKFKEGVLTKSRVVDNVPEFKKRHQDDKLEVEEVEEEEEEEDDDDDVRKPTIWERLFRVWWR